MQGRSVARLRAKETAHKIAVAPSASAANIHSRIPHPTEFTVSQRLIPGHELEKLLLPLRARPTMASQTPFDKCDPPHLPAPGPVQSRELPGIQVTVLNSWKEIANFVGRGIRTVQRWERFLGMPVHRIGHGNRAPVCVLVSELNFWLTKSNNGAPQTANGQFENTPRKQFSKRSHELAANMSSLARSVAESSLRQRRQAELLQERIVRLQARVKAKSTSSALVFLPTRAA